MSMKLQAKLLSSLSSHMEQRYLGMSDVVRLENLSVEMVFKTSQGFMGHSSPEHDFLPYFHMIGEIKEIKGDFPFNVSSLYFRDADRKSMIRDIFYYPTPEELAHIITVGQYYSRNFEIPQILSANTYSLPCVVNLTIVPPPNQAAYETMTAFNFDELADEEKANLPLFYVGLVGTGVSRKNDRLLDYYGIDLEDGYQHFVLTAESSGYVKPSLLEYMQSPTVEEHVEKEADDEYYISPEEEADLLHNAREQDRAAVRQASEKMMANIQADFHEASPEDALLAQADRDIVRRMEQKFGGPRMSLDSLRKRPDDLARIHAEEKSLSGDTGDSSGGFLTEESAASLQGGDVSDARAQAKVNEAYSQDQALGAAVQQQQEQVAEDSVPEDQTDLEHMSGADVSDARAQVKVDEAKAKDVALDAARAQQAEHVAEDHAHREVPQSMQDIADQADHGSDEPEFL